MLPEETSPEVREALEELHLYLSDVLPPLVVAETFKLLIQFPPLLTASNIESWTGAQYHQGSGIKVSDYLFYAVRKVFLIGEFRLVPDEQFAPHFAEVKTRVLDYCPEGEREALRRNMSRLGEATDTITASVDALIRGQAGGPAVSAAPAGPPMSPEELRLLRRFSLLLERFEEGVASAPETEAGKPSDLLTQALAMAARTSRSSNEFEKNLERLGLQMETADVFRTLAAGLPGWTPPVLPEDPEQADAAQAKLPESAPLAAIHKIAVQPQEPGELARRFNQMVKTACERFNAGDLAQAVTMLELAERIIRERRVDEAIVAAVRQKGDESLDLEWLRRYADSPRQHALLRRVLIFFEATRPKGLLAELLREMKREKRKLILQLLEVHGAPARRQCLIRLQAPFGKAEGDEKWYFRRNLLYLLRRIPAPAQEGAPSEEDVDASVRHAVLKFPAPLVKEAVANLGQTRHEKSENTLIGLLDQLEKMLLKPAGAAYDPREARLLLDRVVSALARFGTARARQAVVEHGLKKKAELGDTMARLSELAGQDFSPDTESRERLLAALKASTPTKVFGLVLSQSEANARHLIDALSTTPKADVRDAFSSLARRFPNLEIGKAAARALSTLDAPAAVPETSYDTRSGEMEKFGLPQVVRSFSDAGLSGLLRLKNGRGDVDAEIVLRSGRMKSCAARGLTGEDAFYQLLERPAPATFVFEKQAGDSRLDPLVESLPEILPLCLEGIRRHDELAQASALVPDDAKLAATEVRPDHHPDELDGMFVNGLWKLIGGGATPQDCEGSLKADSYRIRRQLAHWVESGALTIARGTVES
jgi:hypothetical protein